MKKFLVRDYVVPTIEWTIKKIKIHETYCLKDILENFEKQSQEKPNTEKLDKGNSKNKIIN